MLNLDFRTMKLTTYLALATLFLASCTSSRFTTNFADDVYYTPADDMVVVQKMPQSTPQNYTPQTPVPRAQQQVAPVYNDEAIPTEDYALGDVDYERRIRRLRGEEFEYSYERGYVEGFRDANRDNRLNSSWNNGWNTMWYGNSFWARPRGGWHLGYNNWNGWYGGNAWGNPGWGAWGNPYAQGWYGNSWGRGFNNGWNNCPTPNYFYGGWNNGWNNGNQWGNGFNNGWYGNRTFRTANNSDVNTSSGVPSQRSTRYNRAANSPRQGIGSNSINNDGGTVNTRRPSGQRTTAPTINRGVNSSEVYGGNAGDDRLDNSQSRRPVLDTRPTGTSTRNSGTLNGNTVTDGVPNTNEVGNLRRRTPSSSSPSRSVSPSRSTTPSRSYTPSRSSTPSRSVSPSRSTTPSRSYTPSRSSTPSRSVSPSRSTTPSRSYTPSRSSTPSRSASPSRSNSPSRSSAPSSSPRRR